MSIQQVVHDFKDNIILFLDELIEQFPSEANFIMARIFLKDRVSPETIINVFIREVRSLKEDIAKRDEKVFLNNNLSLFNSFDKSTVNHFKVLWKSSSLDDDDKQVIWQWFDTFVYLSEQYQKLKPVE